MKRSLPGSVLAIAALASLVGVAQNAATAVFERAIVTAGPGPQRLAIDAPLLAGSAPFRVVRRGEDGWPWCDS